MELFKHIIFHIFLFSFLQQTRKKVHTWSQDIFASLYLAIDCKTCTVSEGNLDTKLPPRRFPKCCALSQLRPQGNILQEILNTEILLGYCKPFSSPCMPFLIAEKRHECSTKFLSHTVLFFWVILTTMKFDNSTTFGSCKTSPILYRVTQVVAYLG